MKRMTDAALVVALLGLIIIIIGGITSSVSFMNVGIILALTALVLGCIAGIYIN